MGAAISGVPPRGDPLPCAGRGSGPALLAGTGEGGTLSSTERKLPLIQITPGAWLGAAILVYLGEEEILVAFGLSALFHELGHWAAAWLFDNPVTRLRISPSGGVMELSRRCPTGEEGVILAAGPLFNLLQAGLCARAGFPLLAGAGLLLALLNLLPIGPLDGGGLFRLLLGEVLGPWAGEWAAGICSLFSLGALAYGGWVVLVRANGTPALLIFSLWLCFFTISSFFPCHFSLPHVK